MLEQFLDVDSFKFADVVKHWARERLVHEVIIGRELARGVIREGLRFNSVDPKWAKPSTELRGSPLIGFSSRQENPPVILRAIALEHLLAVEREAIDPDLYLLSDEIVSRNDFRKWLVGTGRSFPKCAFRPKADTIPFRWRTPFRRHGGQCSGLKADTWPVTAERCPP